MLHFILFAFIIIPTKYVYDCITENVVFVYRIDMEAKEDSKPEIDDKFWDLLMSADKKDYEGICARYGVTDFRGMLKKLNEKKIEREMEQERVGCIFFPDKQD